VRRVSSSDGIGIAVTESGPADAPVVVAVHGYPDDHSVWEPLAGELGDRYRFVRPDVRGAGASDAPGERRGYRLDRLVDDIVAVIDTVAPERRVHLLGHDWGSIQGWAAIEDPRLAGRIAGYTSISGPALHHASVWMRGLRHHPRAAAGQIAHSYYLALFLLPRVPEAVIGTGLFDKRLGPRPRADEINGLELYRANLRSPAARRRPERIGVPVQVLAPRRDEYVTVECALGAPAPWVRDLRTSVVEGRHWVIKKHPERIAGLVAAFVDEREAASA
jgi:pimeloyl-ACP methyl ester carboxylesterase